MIGISLWCYDTEEKNQYFLDLWREYKLIDCVRFMYLKIITMMVLIHCDSVHRSTGSSCMKFFRRKHPFSMKTNVIVNFGMGVNWIIDGKINCQCILWIYWRLRGLTPITCDSRRQMDRIEEDSFFLLNVCVCAVHQVNINWYSPTDI